VTSADALLVIVMQVGLFEGSTKWDAVGLVAGINALSRRVRGAVGRVIFVRQTMETGDLRAGASGWQLLPDLEVQGEDAFLSKSTCDCFTATELTKLTPLGATRRSL